MPDVSRPLVSVILPTYNRLPYLREAVESVRAQTFPAWELLAIDDGSTDGTAAWLATLDDDRVRHLPVTHCGNPARLRNHGLAAARGRWVAFLDSDDRWPPAKLATQVEALTTRPECGWSYTDVTLIDERGVALERSRFATWVPHSGWILDRLLGHEARIACPTVIVDRELLADLGGFDDDLRFSEDYDLWLRLAASRPVLAIPMPLAEVRLHPGNATRDNPEVNRAFVRVYEKQLARDLTAAQRRLCRRQRASYQVFLADQLSRRGSVGRALGQLARAVLPAIGSVHWWKVTVKAMVRSITPREW